MTDLTKVLIEAEQAILAQSKSNNSELLTLLKPLLNDYKGSLQLLEDQLETEAKQRRDLEEALKLEQQQRQKLEITMLNLTKSVEDLTTLLLEADGRA